MALQSFLRLRGAFEALSARRFESEQTAAVRGQLVNTAERLAASFGPFKRTTAERENI